MRYGSKSTGETRYVMNKEFPFMEDKKSTDYLICSAGHKIRLSHPFNRHKKPGDRCNQLLSYDLIDGSRYCRRILRNKSGKV